ncbi:MAG: hypothetical protein ACLRS8_01095 [Parabacteroides merdae]
MQNRFSLPRKANVFTSFRGLKAKIPSTGTSAKNGSGTYPRERRIKQD